MITAGIIVAAATALNRVWWIHHHRVRAWCETAALVAPGLALLGTWASQHGAGQIGVTLTAAAIVLTAAVYLTARAPAWPVEGKRARMKLHKGRAALRDLPEIVRLARLSFDRLPVSPALLAWWVLRGGCCVERDAGHIAGCVVTFPLRRGIMWVELLAVHPDHRRHGVGLRLLEGLGPVCLMVRESNTGALAFYQRAGFEIVDVWRGYYEKNEQAILLKR